MSRRSYLARKNRQMMRSVRPEDRGKVVAVMFIPIGVIVLLGLIAAASGAWNR